MEPIKGIKWIILSIFFSSLSTISICILVSFRQPKDGITVCARSCPHGSGIVRCQRQVQAASARIVTGQRLQQLILLVGQQDGWRWTEESTWSIAATASLRPEQDATAAGPQPGHQGQGERVPGAVGGVLQLSPVHIGSVGESAGGGAAHHAHRAGIRSDGGAS